VHNTTIYGPESAQDSEEGRFPAPVGADDEEVHAGLDFESEFWDEDVSVRRDDGDFVEFNGGGVDYFAAGLEDIGMVMGGFGMRGGGGRGDEVLFKVARADIGHYV